MHVFILCTQFNILCCNDNKTIIIIKKNMLHYVATPQKGYRQIDL